MEIRFLPILLVSAGANFVLGWAITHHRKVSRSLLAAGIALNLAALAYLLQIYFDFSAYCDMALGISRMFGILLPINFLSPYQSVRSSTSGGAGTSPCRAS